jgi:hypothetical protein
MKIRRGRRSHAGGVVATLVEVVALNALSVSRWVRGVDPGSCESENFWGRGFPSSEPRTSRNAVDGALSVCARGLDRCIYVGGALTQSFLEGFQGTDSSGVYSLLIVSFGYP